MHSFRMEVLHISKQFQDLKTLYDIKKLLLSMELMQTRDVLASDDLYPHGKAVEAPVSIRNGPVRTRSMYCKTSAPSLRRTYAPRLQHLDQHISSSLHSKNSK